MKGKYFVALLTFLFLYQTAYTQCSITSPSTACKGEVIELKAISSTSIDSVRWDFGDGSTGKQTKLNHIYTSAGTLDIKLRVYDTNGDSCDASVKIIVYDPPEINVSLDSNSNYCFSNNNICLLDSTKRGSSNGKIVKRTILWGDGNRSLTNNPSLPNKICHTFLKNGNFTITIQEENQYGCIAEKTMDITIKEDFPLDFREEYSKETCTWEQRAFFTDTLTLNNNVDSFVWDFGDGKFDREYFDSLPHKYFNKGTYVASLTVYSKNGCVNKVSKNVIIDFPEIQIIATVSKDSICVNNTVVLEASKDYGEEWVWLVNGPNEATRLDGRITYFTPTDLGRYKVTLEITDQGCSKRAFIDSIEVVGIKTNFELLNKSQCGNHDTVYACNLSAKYGTSNYSFSWDFGDSLSSQCHSDSAKNYKLDSNCNYHTGVNAKHFYNQEYCGRVTLIAVDHDNQCVDSLKDDVTLLTTSRDAFGYIAPNRCLGGGNDNSIKFLRQPCLRGIKVNYDSACDKDNFVGFIDFYSYKNTCDTTGNVTVGFAISNGSDKIYQSCDTSDYIKSTQNLCIDTIWYHHWFALSKAPNAKFFIDTNERCAPAKMKFTLYNPKQTNIKKAEWLWGDGTSSEFTYFPGTYDSLPSQYHDYDRESEFDMRLTLETDSGCKEAYHWDFELGYSNDFYLPQDTCVNDTVEMYDTLRYWDSNARPWRDVSNPNLGITWDFDDGRGFATTGPLPKIAYKQPGKYNIRMASWDEYGCSDTVAHEITITCAVAGIKQIDNKLLCGGIVRFLDSSSTKLGLGRITQHYWDFGDATTPSFIQNPFHYYRKFGSFKVTHIVATDNGCSDTATFNMVVEGPTSEFDIVSDSIGCVPFTVEVENQSINASRYIWEFGDSANVKITTFSDTNMTFTYTKPGTYYIRLLALDSIWDPNINDYIYCESYYPDSINHPDIFKKVIVQDRPEVAFRMPDKICKNERILIEALSDTAYKNHIWKFSSGEQVQSTSDSAYFTFKDTGTFTVNYAPTFTVLPPLKNCFDTASKEIRVSGVEAFFEYTQADDCPIFTFRSLSENYDTLSWDFGDPESDNNTSNAKEVVHEYENLEPDAQVCLTATNKDGCKDTFCEALQSESNVKIFIPNVFTPNRDDYNNEYEIEIEGETSYELLIYNRWGDLVYESHQDSELGEGLNWNGKWFNKGKEVSEGVYFFIFRYELNCGSTSDEVEGTITLIR